MLAHQPGNRPRFVLTHTVFETERFSIDGAQLRVISAPAFRNVMEESGQVNDLGFLE